MYLQEAGYTYGYRGTHSTVATAVTDHILYYITYRHHGCSDKGTKF